MLKSFNFEFELHPLRAFRRPGKRADALGELTQEPELPALRFVEREGMGEIPREMAAH